MADPRKYLQTLITSDAGFTKTDSHAIWLFPDGTLVKVMGYLQGGGYTANCFKNTNNGVGAWTSIASFPGYARHWFTSGVIGNEGFVVGGDGNVDMWKYNYLTNTWTQVSADLGIPPIYIAGRGFAGGNFYILGGQTQGDAAATPLLKLYKITPTGVVTDMGNLPLTYTSCGVFFPITDTHWIYISGGIYATSTVFNTEIIETTNAGVSWTVLDEELPEEMTGLFSTGGIWAGVLWYLVANKEDGLYYSGDFGRNWLRAPYPPRKRHASGGPIVNALDEFLTIGGMNAETSQVEADIYKYEKVPFS